RKKPAPYSLVWHLNCKYRFQHINPNGDFPMSYYQVSLRGRPVAIVKTIDLAQTIARCRRRGYYAIEKLENGEDVPSATKRQQKTSAPKRPVKTTSKLGKSRTGKTARKQPSPKPSNSR